MGRTAAAGVSPATAVLGLFLLFGLIVASFFPFLSIYLEGRGFEPDEIGFLLGAMALVRIVAMPVWGHVADTRTGRKLALQLGLVGMVLFALVASVLDSFVGVAFGLVGIALAMAASGPNIDALTLVHLGDERMAEYSRIRGWESLTYASACCCSACSLSSTG
jgi:MFS transporter, PPP family, 3-phenylpropionic acid transporter